MRRHAMVILLALCGSTVLAGSVAAQDLRDDLSSALITDEAGTRVSLYIPESLANDQSERRLYGTPGLLDMFRTLYHVDRRTESYKRAIRELAMQPELSGGESGALERTLERAGVAAEDISTVLSLIEQGGDALADELAIHTNKRFVQGGTASGDVHNAIARVGRQLQEASERGAVRNSEAIKAAALGLEDLQATGTLGELLMGAILLNATAVDAAEQRFETIRSVLEDAAKQGGGMDPALAAAIEEAEIEIRAARTAMGSFAVAVNDRLDDIVDSGISLGASLAQPEIAAALHLPAGAAAFWIGAPLKVYSTLRNISGQWETAQDATAMATLVMTLRNHRPAAPLDSSARQIERYGAYSFYAKMEEALSTREARLHDVLSPGSANADWAEYYADRKSQLWARLRTGANVARMAEVEVETGDSTRRLESSGPARRPRSSPAKRVLLIFDTSGSMDGQPLADAKRAARRAVSSLAAADEVAILRFAGCGVRLAVDFTTDKQAALEAIDAFNAVGSTPLAAALAEATSLIGSDPRDGRTSVVLLTDGAETCDAQSAALQAADRLGVVLRGEISGRGASR